MKPEILMTSAMTPDLTRQLAEAFTIRRLWLAEDEARFLAAECANVRGVATRSVVGADAALMQALPKLEIISTFGVGTDLVDLAAAAARGIHVTNTPGVLTEDTADFGFTLLLALARRVVEGDRFVREGKWLKGQLPASSRVFGRRLGIVGMGRIGQAIARRAGGFDMAISWHGPNPKPHLPYAYEPGLLGLARAVDYLVLACPGGRATEGIINAAVLEALGPDGMLVNIARASVLDEPAVIKALQDKAIAGAAFDVYADEPHVPEALLALDNVVLEPHSASGTVQTRKAIGDLLFANLQAHFEGRTLLSPVTKA